MVFCELFTVLKKIVFPFLCLHAQLLLNLFLLTVCPMLGELLNEERFEILFKVD